MESQWVRLNNLDAPSYLIRAYAREHWRWSAQFCSQVTVPNPHWRKNMNGPEPEALSFDLDLMHYRVCKHQAQKFLRERGAHA